MPIYAQVSLAYWYSVGMTILRSRVRIPVVALSFLFDSKHLYEAMIYWVYSCDYSLLEAPWSKRLALLDFIHISTEETSTNETEKWVNEIDSSDTSCGRIKEVYI